MHDHVNIVCIGSVTSKAYQKTRLRLLREGYRPRVVRLDYKHQYSNKYTVRYADNRKPQKFVEDIEVVMVSSQEMINSIRDQEPVAVFIGADAMSAWDSYGDWPDVYATVSDNICEAYLV